MLTFIVLPHWSIMPQTLDMIPHPVTLSRHWVGQSYPVSVSAKRWATSTIFNEFGMLRPGIEPVTSRSPKRTLYHLSYRGRYLFVCLCWGLTSQSTIFQSCRDGATASWVINQYFRGVKCLAQGHNTAAVGFEPPTFRSGVRHSTTEPPRSPPGPVRQTVS